MGVIVTGMHRSGTSAVARVVERLGLSAGGPAMGPAPDNPRGFFERRDVMDLNDRWLETLGGSWSAPPPTSPSTWRSLDPDALAQDRAKLGLFDPTAGPWFVKDPRISLLLPLWDRLALQALPVVLAVRDPREVATSLRVRNGLTARRSVALWFFYLRASLLTAGERPLLVLDYDQLVASPESGVDSLASFILDQVGALPEAATLEQLAALVESGLQRNRASGLQGLSGPEMDEAVEAYLRVAKAHADAGETPAAPELPEWVAEVLDELRDEHAREQAAAQAADVIVRLEQDLAAAAQSDERLEAIQQRLTGLEAERTRLAERAVELESLLQREREAAEQSQLSFEELRVEAEQGRGQLLEAERGRAVVDAELQRIRTQLTESEEASARVSQELAGARDQVELLESRTNFLTDTGADREAALEQMRSLAQVAERGQQTAVREVEELRDRLGAQREEAERSIAVLQIELQSVRARSLSADQQVADLNDAMATAKSDAEAIQGHLERSLTEALGLAEARAEEVSRLNAIAAVGLRDRARLEAAVQRATETIDRLTEDLARAIGERAHLLSATEQAAGERQALEVALQQLQADRDELARQNVLNQEDLQRANALSTELASLASDLRVRVRDAETRAAMSAEAAQGLTVAMAEARGQRGTAEQAARVAGDQAAQWQEKTGQLKEELSVEVARVGRLSEALAQALGASQARQTEIDGIHASRSYRYGRRLTAPGRMLRGEHSEADDGVSTSRVPDVRADEIVAVISSGLFDADWYRGRYPDVNESGVDPFFHFMTQGWREGRNPSPAFDTVWYRHRYMGNEQVNVNPLLDHLRSAPRNDWLLVPPVAAS